MSVPNWIECEDARRRVDRRIKRSGLTEQQQSAVKLWLFSRSGFRRISQEMGVTPAAARDFVRRGLEHIRQDAIRRGEFDSLRRRQGPADLEIG